MGIFVDPQNLEACEVSSIVGGNPTLEIDNGEINLFPYKRGHFPHDLKGEEIKGNHESPPPKSGRP